MKMIKRLQNLWYWSFVLI